MKSNPKYEISITAQKELTDLLGEKNVCFTRDLLSVYRAKPFGQMFREAVNPHGMVQPETVEDVQGILKIANKYEIPLILAATMGPGACLEGGLIVDMYSRMRKIHKIDPECGYALVEPGVTCGQLLKALRPHGCWVSFGSYPPIQSNLSTLVCCRAQTNAIGKEDDFCRGIEVVLPTGEIVKTGSAGLGYDMWADTHGIPNLKWLWQPSMGTLGIITKAAIRIHPLGEVQDIVIAGFNNFDNAIEWSHKITREVMVNTSMVWSYHWVQWENYAHNNGKGFVKYINDMLTLKPDEAPPGYYPMYAFASISGFKEQVEGNVKACQRLAKELGGEIVNEKFKEQNPGCWNKWEHSFLEHVNPGMALERSHIYGVEAGMEAFTVETNVRDGKSFHHAILRRLYEKHGLRHVRYYTRQLDHGRTSFQRYLFMHDAFDQETLDREIEVEEDLLKWTSTKEFKEQFPNIVPFAPVAHSSAVGEIGKKEEEIPVHYGLMELDRRIQEVLDPNNIMDPVMRRKEE